jgi:predicted GH43/DUF377 family glycosyl hydrolase
MRRHVQNPLITPEMVVPSHADLVVRGAFNPGAVRCGDEYVLILRVAEGGRQLADEVCVPRYRFVEGEARLEVLRLDPDDPDVRRKDTRAVVYQGQEYPSTLSHLRLARSTDGVHFVVDAAPFWAPSHESEALGVEDARVVAIDGWYYINYTAVSRDSYGTSLLRTRDFVDTQYLGMIFSVSNKDVCIFPEKIGGLYHALHRPHNHDFGKSSIWIAQSPDLVHWGNHRCLIRPRPNEWESEKIGGGAPPIKTDRGWLAIYHGKALREKKDFYSLLVLLLDLDDPTRVLYRGSHPILRPQAPYETAGFVPNVVFLNGMVVGDDGELHLYYAAGDETTCLARCHLEELLPA